MTERGDAGASRTRTIRLRRIRDRDSRLVGAKALNLARMIRARLPVPPGFCVTGAAYREHVDSAPLAGRVRNLLDAVGSGGGCDNGIARRTATTESLAGLRRAIVEAPLSEALSREIEGHYRALGPSGPSGSSREVLVAVRSSATAEDLPGHSFAGQYDTFLGVADLAGCLDAVKRCWASLWTERAFEYRERNGIDHAGVDMAVVVQELVPAEAAGVLFTADPVTGRRDRIVIEGCAGLGEALVSGKVTPDRFVLSKRKLRVLERAVSTKAFETVLDPAGGVRERTVAGDRAARPCLDDRAARRLAKLALRAEKAFGAPPAGGAPQDMEWALARGRLYILQSRPITTLARPTSWEDRQVWTNANAGEVMPDVVTPFTWSLMEPFLDNVFRTLPGAIGLDICERPIGGLIAGRVYFNASTLMGMGGDLPFARYARSEAMRATGGNDAAVAELDRMAREDVPRGRLGLLRIVLRLPGFVRWILWHSPERGEFLAAAWRRGNREFDRLDAESLPDAEIVSSVQRAGTDFVESGSWIIFAFSAIGCFFALDKICRRWFGDADGPSPRRSGFGRAGGTFARRLVGGLSGMRSAEAGLAVWRLADLAGRHEGLRSAILSERTFEAARARIARERGGDEFLAAWREFMREHGHHARGEIEHANARWSETPDKMLAMVRGHLENIELASPVARQAALAADRRRLTRECRSKLRNPIKRVVFDYLLRKAQRGCLFRENMKSEWIRRMAASRRMLLELGRRLVARGILNTGEDIFFLRFEEIEPVVKGAAAFDIRETIAGRRAEYEKNLAITPPAVVVGRFDPDDFVPDPVDEAATTFEGIASGPGVVTGRARVVTRAGEDMVRPGEILVAPFTDPGWTPFFVNAAGIVMDLGGLLSHGSIIAREYGIPAVVNVGPATKIVKTGQMLRVDGDRGVVSILGEGPSDPGETSASSVEPSGRATAAPSARRGAPAARRADALEDRQVWTNANSGEVMPDVVTPLTWSLVVPVLENVCRMLLGAIGLDLGERPVAGLIAGRVYFNATTMTSMVNRIPFARNDRSKMTRIFGGNEAAMAVLDRIAQDDVPRIGLGWLRVLFKLPGGARWFMWHSPQRARFLLAGGRKRTARLERLDPGRLSTEEIVRRIWATTQQASRRPTGLVYTIAAISHVALLDRVCRVWFDDPEGTVAQRLVRGLPGMQSAEAGLALWRLAELAGRHEGLRSAVLEERTFGAVRGRVAGCRAGDRFLAEWEAFMREHGHHTRGEYEFANPRWSERPDDMLDTVRGYLKGLGTTDPVARQRRLAAERVALAEECRRSIRNPVKRVIFDFLLARAQLGSVVRDNLKSEGVRMLAAVRRMLLELGERLARRGVLGERDDVFFLRLEELAPVNSGRAGFDVRETVAARRAEHRRDLTVTPPAVVVGRFDPDDLAPDELSPDGLAGGGVETEAKELSGLAVSAGVVRGRARVVLRAGTDQVLPGEILVAPFTDPGWTPYFLNAAGIVMDMGGLLSHGSIIAREYGIPAVVNVGPATKIVQTGQMLEVDGDRGRVRIIG